MHSAIISSFTARDFLSFISSEARRDMKLGSWASVAFGLCLASLPDEGGVLALQGTKTLVAPVPPSPFPFDFLKWLLRLLWYLVRDDACCCLGGGGGCYERRE